jgi:hypothetical protein
MNDVFLEWGADIGAGPTGDLALATGTDAINQRICRRLLTNAGDYLWDLDYGGSLGLFVGAPVDSNAIEAIIRSQLTLETAVPADPPPTVSLSVANQATGVITSTITYADPTAAAHTTVAISVSPT